MDLGVRDTHALVTGGTGRIGFAIARRLGLEGAHLTLCGRHEGRLSAALERLTAEGVAVQGRVCDVQDDRSVAAFFAWLADQHRGLDILINNPGGVVQAGRFQDVPPEAFTQGVQVNVARGALPLMQGRAWGRVVNMGAWYFAAGDLTLLRRFAENAVAKTAVSALTKVMSDDLAPHVTVNCVAPGPVGEDHPMAPETQAYPVPRPASAEELADLVAFLCSRQAGYLTGLTIPVDGGLTRRLV